MGTSPPIRKARMLALGAAGAVLTVAVLLWLAVRLPWRHDPLQVGVYERLIEGQGYVWRDVGAGGGVQGYAVRTRNQGRWAERIYVHPGTGGELMLKRNLRGDAPGHACTVRSLNEEGRAALVRVAAEFSPWLAKRIAEAEGQSRSTGRWVRVVAPDFDLSVTADDLTIDSRPGEYTGMGAGRLIERAFWKLSRLFGKA